MRQHINVIEIIYSRRAWKLRVSLLRSTPAHMWPIRSRERQSTKYMTKNKCGEKPVSLAEFVHARCSLPSYAVFNIIKISLLLLFAIALETWCVYFCLARAFHMGKSDFLFDVSALCVEFILECLANECGLGRSAGSFRFRIIHYNLWACNSINRVKYAMCVSCLCSHCSAFGKCQTSASKYSTNFRFPRRTGAQNGNRRKTDQTISGELRCSCRQERRVFSFERDGEQGTGTVLRPRILNSKYD